MASLVKRLKIGNDTVYPITHTDAIKVKNQTKSLTTVLDELANASGSPSAINASSVNYQNSSSALETYSTVQDALSDIISTLDDFTGLYGDSISTGSDGKVLTLSVSTSGGDTIRQAEWSTLPKATKWYTTTSGSGDAQVADELWPGDGISFDGYHICTSLQTVDVAYSNINSTVINMDDPTDPNANS